MGLHPGGLALATAFGRRVPTIGFDRSVARIAAYQQARDPDATLPGGALASAWLLEPTADPRRLAECDLVVTVVPAWREARDADDTEAIARTCARLAPYLRPGATVVLEGSASPGTGLLTAAATLAALTGRRWQHDFWLATATPEEATDRRRIDGDTPDTRTRVAHTYALAGLAPLP